MHATFTGRKTVFLTQGNMYSSLTGAKTAFAYICSNSNIAFGYKLRQSYIDTNLVLPSNTDFYWSCAQNCLCSFIGTLFWDGGGDGGRDSRPDLIEGILWKSSIYWRVRE